MVWSSPLQMALYLYFMYQEIGVAIFAGLGIFLLAMPLNALIAKMSEKYQKKKMKDKDKRMKLMNEVLGGMRVIKLYGWEPSFISQVQHIRGEEEKDMLKFAWVNAITSLVFTMLPYIALLSSFATFIFMDSNNILTAEKAFVTLSYMGQLSMQIIAIPMIIVSLIQARVSLKRVNKFMNNEEMDGEAVQHNKDVRDQIQIKSGDFKWGSTDDWLTLEHINFTVPPGSLIAVVGSVGSGKSSLLSAVLGDMIKVSGSVNVGRSIAYVPQQAW